MTKNRKRRILNSKINHIMDKYDLDREKATQFHNEHSSKRVKMILTSNGLISKKELKELKKNRKK